MAFRAGNRARKKESAAQTTESIDSTTLEYCVGDYTRKIDKCCMDRLRAAVYYHRHQEKSEDKYDDEKLEEEDEFKKISKEDIAKESLAILQAKKYCFNPIIRKIFAGEITDFVAYPYPVNCGLELEEDEKKLLIDINNFKCSFMEETMGNLYLNTKIILKDEEETYPDDINKLFNNEEIPEKDREKMSYKEIIGKTDRLGFYTTHSYKNSNKEEYVEPEVWLLINKIRRIESLKKLHPYILAKVYIHEMMHRYFDMHPELPFKSSVKEIEEPMAELATIEFCEEFCNKHKEYSKLVDVAKEQIKDLKATDDNYFYALGADLYELYDEEKRRSLIDIYRHVCMMFHEQNKEVIAYLNLVRDSENINKYQEGDEGVKKQFCEALINC